MKRKKKKSRLPLYFGLLAIVAITVYGTMFSVAFSVVDAGNGDQYIEYRCIDTSRYESQGYKLDHVDEHGCRIVAKNIKIAECKTRKSSGQKACDKYCGGMKHCGKKGLYDVCCQYNTDYEGGYEQIVNTCNYDQNDLLAGETFAGPRTINKFSLKYPVKGFCKAHPAIFTDDALKKSITSTTVYDKLISGETVTVEQGQTLTMFFIIENNKHLPTICDSGENQALNLDTNNTCMSTLGFSFFCSDGVFDALTGTCVVQGTTVCEPGYRYDLELGACIRNPPHQVDCQDDNCYYSIDRDACICYPNEEYPCPDGFKLEEPGTKEECNAVRGVWELCPQCPADKVCPESVCSPRCSLGQKCVWDSPMLRQCKDENATIRDGSCFIDGEEIIICPDGYELNGEVCEKYAESKLICEDRTEPIKDKITGRMICPSTPPTYVNCGPDEVIESGECVPQISVYDPDKEDFTIYKELQRMCESDADCRAIDPGLACNKNTGICYTEISGLRVENIRLNQTIERLKSQMLYGLIAIVVLYVPLMLLVAKKGRKSGKRRRK